MPDIVVKFRDGSRTEHTVEEIWEDDGMLLFTAEAGGTPSGYALSEVQEYHTA